jgi:ribonuclease HI
VAATAVVAGSLYSILKQEQVILKVDGSLLREREKPSAGCGGFLSSASEKWICGFAQKLNPNLKENETEMEAILRGLVWVKGKGEKKVVVKTDCEGIANLVNSGRRSRRRSNDRVICGIRDLLNSNQWEASLSSISRGENAVADRLARSAHSSTSYDLQEHDDPPPICLQLL